MKYVAASLLFLGAPLWCHASENNSMFVKLATGVLRFAVPGPARALSARLAKRMLSAGPNRLKRALPARSRPRLAIPSQRIGRSYEV